ncbi:MAG: hypothetical protein WCF17_22360 [Terracidiphilus sp.]
MWPIYRKIKNGDVLRIEGVKASKCSELQRRFRRQPSALSRQLGFAGACAGKVREIKTAMSCKLRELSPQSAVNCVVLPSVVSLVLLKTEGPKCERPRNARALSSLTVLSLLLRIFKTDDPANFIFAIFHAGLD